MSRLIYLSILFCLLCAGTASAQTYLRLTAPRYYQYGGDMLPPEILIFPYDKETENLVERISSIAGLERTDSFLIAANVTDAVALLHKGKRHILYNWLYFRKKDESMRKALLAHMIGLHANQSQFPVPNTLHWEEEIKADEFMGYALALLGVKQEVALSVPDRLQLGFPVDAVDRRVAILRGWQRGNSRIEFEEGANFSEEDKAKLNPEGIAEFPCCPPPQCSNRMLISECFAKCKTLGEVKEELSKALSSCGYTSQAFFRVKDGFALATQLEQYNSDGTYLKVTEARWNAKSPRETTFNPLVYLKSLLSSEPGHFRVFVFLATSQSIGSKSGSKPTYQEAKDWLAMSAASDLPLSIKNQKFIPGKTNVTALVYEYEVPKSTRVADLVKPNGLLQTEVHLKKSGILDYNKKPPCSCCLSQKN